MRRWILFSVELVISLASMAASFNWIPYPFNIMTTLGIAIASGIIMAPNLASQLGDHMVSFIYGTNSRGLGEDYEYEKVDAEYRRLWAIIMSTWYLVLFFALGGIIWSVASLMGQQKGDPAFWQTATLVVGGLLWFHFIALYFVPQFALTQQRWLDKKQLEEIDREYEKAVMYREHARQQAMAGSIPPGEVTEAEAVAGPEPEGEPPRERHDPFYREPPAAV